MIKPCIVCNARVRVAGNWNANRPTLCSPACRRARKTSVLELGHAKSEDAHCLACGFEMVGGRHVGLCPKCGSDRWYRTRLSPNTRA